MEEGLGASLPLSGVYAPAPSSVWGVGRPLHPINVALLILQLPLQSLNSQVYQIFNFL